MWRKAGYIEIRSPEHINVRSFLDRSENYKGLVRIPINTLNATNKMIFVGLTNPATFEALETQLQKVATVEGHLVGNFFGGFFDANKNFDYYLMRLKSEYDDWKIKNEKTPLL